MAFMDAETNQPSQPGSGHSTGSETPRLRRVMKLSRALRLICRILMAGLVLASAATVANVFLGAAPPQNGALPGPVYLPAVLLAYLWWFASILLLERMFNAFLHHGVFHPAGARCLKWLGAIYLLCGTLPVVGFVIQAIADPARVGELLTLVVAALNPALLGGLILLMIGWILEEACELRAEQDLTI